MLEFIHDFNGWMMMPVGLMFLALELWVFKHLLIERGTATGPRSVMGPKPTATATPKPRFASVIRMPASR